MSRFLTFTLALCQLSLFAGEALAVGGNHPSGKIAPNYNSDWPKGLPDLINSADRCGGHWVNQGDFFFYRGDAAALKLFLETFGKLPNSPLVVVLHAGSKPMTGPLGGEQKTPYDWQLEIVRRGWGVPIDPRLPADEPGYIVTIHIWLSDALALENLAIPKHIEVKSAGDIQRFVERHSSQTR